MTVTARQPYPVLDAATEAALKASIERFGVLVPVVVDQHGDLLDGHHRRRIAEEVGVDCPVAERYVDGEEEAREIVRTLNEDRRMLTKEQRLPIVAALREEGHSLRAIAGAVGTSHVTVLNDIAGGKDLPPPDSVVGKDGKSYPVTNRITVAKRPTTGRRGLRNDKDAPFEAESVHKQNIAAGHRQKLEDGLSEINGICRGLRDLDLGIAAAAYQGDDIDPWIKRAGELSSSLRELRSRLMEVKNGGK